MNRTVAWITVLHLCGSTSFASEPSWTSISIECASDRVRWFGERLEGDHWWFRLYPGEELECSIGVTASNSHALRALTAASPASAWMRLLLVRDEPDGFEHGNTCMSQGEWARFSRPDHVVWLRPTSAVVSTHGIGERASASVTFSYDDFPVGHSRLVVLIPAESLAGDCPASAVGLLSQTLTVLASPPRTAAEDDWVRLRQADRSLRDGRPADAESAVRSLLVTYPTHALLHAKLGECLEVLGRPAEALAEYQEAVRLVRAGQDVHGPVQFGVTPEWESWVGSWERACERLAAVSHPN